MDACRLGETLNWIAHQIGEQVQHTRVVRCTKYRLATQGSKGSFTTTCLPWLCWHNPSLDWIWRCCVYKLKWKSREILLFIVCACITLPVSYLFQPAFQLPSIQKLERVRRMGTKIHRKSWSRLHAIWQDEVSFCTGRSLTLFLQIQEKDWFQRCMDRCCLSCRKCLLKKEPGNEQATIEVKKKETLTQNYKREPWISREVGRGAKVRSALRQPSVQPKGRTVNNEMMYPRCDPEWHFSCLSRKSIGMQVTKIGSCFLLCYLVIAAARWEDTHWDNLLPEEWCPFADSFWSIEWVTLFLK